MDTTLKMQRSCTLAESHWMLQKVRILVCQRGASGKNITCIQKVRIFKRMSILSNLQDIKTTWKSSTVRLQLLPLSKRQDTYLQLLTESWMLLSFEMIFVSFALKFFFFQWHIHYLPHLGFTEIKESLLLNAVNIDQYDPYISFNTKYKDFIHAVIFIQKNTPLHLANIPLVTFFSRFESAWLEQSKCYRCGAS